MSISPSFSPDRPLEADDNTFIQGEVGESHQEIYFRGWAAVQYESRDVKKRILVITTFRILTVKINLLLGRSVRQNFPILHLTRLYSPPTPPPDSLPQLHVYFSDSPLVPFVIESPRCIEIAHHLLFAFYSIGWGRAEYESVSVELPATWLHSFVRPEPDVQDGLLATYLAHCDLHAIPQRVSVLDYLMTCFQCEDRTFDLSECLMRVSDSKDTNKDVIALAHSLRYSSWFTELSCVDYPLKDSGLQALSDVFTRKTQVDKLVLVNIKAAKVGFQALAKALSEHQHGLRFLNLSKNAIGDAGMKLIADALDVGERSGSGGQQGHGINGSGTHLQHSLHPSPSSSSSFSSSPSSSHSRTDHVLHTWCLRDVGLGNKGFVSLFQVLTKPKWLSELRVLDISDNKAGKMGTAALASWLSDPALELQQLFLVRCDLEIDVLLKAVLDNKTLITNHLRTLNISGNKFSSKKSIPLLSDILTHSVSLSQFFLANVALSKTGFSSLLDAAISNSNGVRFSLDVSSNELGVKGAKELSGCYEKWQKQDPHKVNESGVINTLVLSDNDLGNEGIMIVCKALKQTSIHTLVLDANLKVGMFTSGKEAGEALAALISANSHLRELSVNGDDKNHFMKQALHPLFLHLANNSSLTHLDVSGNRVGDEGVKVLSESLMANNTLTSFNIDNNKLSIKGLYDLHKASAVNRNLIDWTIPMKDIAKIFKNSSDKKIKQLRMMVHEFEMHMDRNLELAAKAGKLDAKLLHAKAVLAGGGSGCLSSADHGAASPADNIDHILDSRAPYASVTMRLTITHQNDETTFATFAHPSHRTTHRKAASRMFDELFFRAKVGGRGGGNGNGTDNGGLGLSGAGASIGGGGGLAGGSGSDGTLDDDDSDGDDAMDRERENEEEEDDDEIELDSSKMHKLTVGIEAAEREREKELELSDRTPSDLPPPPTSEPSSPLPAPPSEAEAGSRAGSPISFSVSVQSGPAPSTGFRRPLIATSTAPDKAPPPPPTAAPPPPSSSSSSPSSSSSSSPSSSTATLFKSTSFPSSSSVLQSSSSLSSSSSSFLSSVSTASRTQSSLGAISAPVTLSQRKDGTATTATTTTTIPVASLSSPSSSNPSSAASSSTTTTSVGSASSPTNVRVNGGVVSSGSVLEWRSTAFSFEELKSGVVLPAGVDPTIRELYLSDAEFQTRFGQTKAQFQALAKWKQVQAKKTQQLF